MQRLVQRRKADLHLEQIPVNHQREGAAHQLCQALRNRQTQPAALGRARAVPTNKAFHQLIGGNVQPLPRHIFHRYNGHARVALQIEINPCLRHGIFHNICHHVIKHPPQQPAVRENHRFFAGKRHNRLEPGSRQLFGVLPRDLPQQLADAGRGGIDRDIARGRLGGLQQILKQLFQPHRLTVQYFDVLLCLFALHLFLFQKVHIIDNGGQRRFDIVADVGQQLTAHPVAFDALLNRLDPFLDCRVNAAPDGVQRFAVRFEFPLHGVGRQAVVQVARRNLLRALVQPDHLAQNIEIIPQDKRVEQHCREREKTIVYHQQEHDNIQKPHTGKQQHAFPDKRQDIKAPAQAVPKPRDDSASVLQNPRADRADRAEQPAKYPGGAARPAADFLERLRALLLLLRQLLGGSLAGLDAFADLSRRAG